MDPSPTLAPRPSSRAGFDALAPLTFLGWWPGLAAIVLSLAVSFFLYGYAVAYWRNADMDFMVIYNALVLNDGKPQQFFDHTGYLTILIVKVWFQILHGLGLLTSYSLSSMPPASDPHGFDAAMTSAVRAGRLVAWLIATASVLVFAGLIRSVVRDWRLALIATFAFAFSGGIAVHERILRTELVAACPVIFALMILIVIGLVRLLEMGMARNDTVYPAPQQPGTGTDWEHPGVSLWDAPDFLTVQQGDSFSYSCSYVNTASTAVTVGETAASNEMCMAIGYYYPAGTTTCN